MPYAVVTGATHGIGRAVTEQLLKEGFSVAVCARNEQELQALETKWNSDYPNASVLIYPTDLSVKENVLAFAGTVLSNFPQVDILVNNAGIFLPGTLANEADGHLEATMNVNLYSVYHLTRALLPSMMGRNSGHIFNMCSVASLKAYPNGGSYSISKYALLGFSENLREELKPFNIRVTAVCPGATWSRSWETSGIDEQRMMDAKDVAKMIWATYETSPRTNVETIVMRPLKGDI